MILPFVKPIIGGFSHQASLYGILSAYPETELWRHCNYIQIYTLKTLTNSNREGTLDFYHDIYGDFSFHEQFSTPWLRMNRISRDIAEHKWGTVEKYVIEQLNQREYVYIVMNTRPIFGLDYDRYHPVLLYGHQDGRTLLGYDNHPDGVYGPLEIDMSMYSDCFRIPLIEDECPGRLEGIITHLFRKHETDIYLKYKNSFLLHKLRHDLFDYLHPRRDADDLYVFGTDCYDALSQYALRVAEYPWNKLDKRAISALLDHKRLMTARIEFLGKRYNIDRSLSVRYYDNVEKHLHNTQLLYLKYNRLQKKEILTRITERLLSAQKAEKDLLEELYLALPEIETC